MEVVHPSINDANIYDNNNNNDNSNENNNNNNNNDYNPNHNGRYSMNEDQAFKGELTGVNVYNYAMCLECFRLIADPCISTVMRGNVISWPPDMDNMGDVDLVKGNACRD